MSGYQNEYRKANRYMHHEHAGLEGLEPFKNEHIIGL